MFSFCLLLFSDSFWFLAEQNTMNNLRAVAIARARDLIANPKLAKPKQWDTLTRFLTNT
jgi:hypothetical protein